MANQEHIGHLQQNYDNWYKWRINNLSVSLDFSEADLRGLNLSRRNLSHANFTKANLQDADFQHANLSSADLSRSNLSAADFSNANLQDANFQKASLIATTLSGANLIGADFSGADFRHAYLHKAVLKGAKFLRADLREADFTGADLSYREILKGYYIEANLNQANLSGTDFTGADLTRANLSETYLHETIFSGATLIDATLTEAFLRDTDFSGANLSGCRIFGISAWRVNLEGAKQSNLIITEENESTVTVDDLEVAQFMYLLLRNEKLRNVIDTVTTKCVLILGRFTPKRKPVLEAIGVELRKQGYVPILFVFKNSDSRDLTEMVITLASLSRFVIADLSDPNSIPHELMAFAEKFLSVPIQPIFCPVEDHKDEYPVFEHLTRYPHILPIHRYKSSEDLIKTLSKVVIEPAEAKVKAMRPRHSK